MVKLVRSECMQNVTFERSRTDKNAIQKHE